MDTKVSTPYGTLQGIEEKDSYCFRGIPYAKPPVGELRFRSPQEPDAWEGVRDASRFAKDPMQRYMGRGPECYSEDCLYVNVWVPKGAEGPLPVMVWIPGGAYATGGVGALSPEGPSLYECNILAKDMQAVIVAVSYRLNVFGFLNLSKFNARFEDDLGLKDLLAALRWVQKCAASFGGDPDNVTIFGESAGAGAISTLMVMPAAEPLFHKAIMQSNCFGSYYTPAEEEDICRRYLELLGLDAGRAEELLGIDYPALYDAADKLTAYALQTYFPRCTFCPVVDGTFVTDYPTLAALDRQPKPVLIGSNRNEGNFLVMTSDWASKDPEGLSRYAFHRLPNEQAEALAASYPQAGKQTLADVLTEVMYTFPKLRFAEHASRSANVYVYRYDFVTPLMKRMKLFACHIAEMLPLFDLKAKPYGSLGMFARGKLKAIGTRMRRYWGAFARTGRPEVPGQIEWKPYDEKDRCTLVIDAQDRLVPDAESECRKRFEGIERVVV